MKTKLYLPEGLVSENPFWFFSLSLWEDSNLRKHLLWLQNERSMRISLLLYSAWSACQKRYVQWQTLNADQTLTQWQQHMVDPIRSARVKLAGGTDSVAKMKKSIQAVELQAEQWEMAILYHELTYFTQTKDEGTGFDALLENLLVYTNKETQSLRDSKDLITCLMNNHYYQAQINEMVPVDWAMRLSALGAE